MYNSLTAYGVSIDSLIIYIIDESSNFWKLIEVAYV
jgi:hypothetical protein